MRESETKKSPGLVKSPDILNPKIQGEYFVYDNFKIRNVLAELPPAEHHG